MSTPTLRVIDTQGEESSDFDPLIPPGIYEARYIDHETWFNYRRPKIKMRFSILKQGEHFGKIIPAYFGVKKLKGKPSKFGHFVPGKLSKFTENYVRLFGRPHRLDKIPMSNFGKVIICVKVETVTNTSWGAKHAPGLEYSKIDEFLKVKEL